MIIDLSHLGHEIHRRYDEHGIIQVFDDGNKRYLSFGTADEQSCQLKSNPIQPQHDYVRAMLSVLMQTNAPDRIAVIGTGGGGLTSFLYHNYLESHIDTVDLRSAVIHIAHQYFGLPRSPRLSTHVCSANEFLAKKAQTQDTQYDLIFSDIYLADGLSTEQLNADFLMHSRQLLSNNGWLVLNLWKEHRGEDAFIQQLEQHFSTLTTATTKDGNWLILASPKADALVGKTECRQRAKVLSEQLGFNLWNHAKGFYKG